MFPYLNNAVYGYRAQARKMEAIGENVANAATSGYKAHEVRFQNLSSKKPTLIGKEGTSGGVRSIASIDVLAQGILQTTAHGGDLAIDGQGLLPVREGFSSKGPICGLRTGSFRLDKNGYMTNEAGYVLQGRRLDTQTPSPSSTLASLEAVRINLKTQERVTTSVQTPSPPALEPSPSLPSAPEPTLPPSPPQEPEPLTSSDEEELEPPSSPEEEELEPPEPTPPVSSSPSTPSLVEETIFPYIPLPLYPESGKEYTFSLTVSDDLGETHTATIKGTGESTRLLKKTLNGADKSYFQKAFYELGWVSSNEDTAWAELVSGAGGTWAAVEAVLINQDFFNDIAASAGAPAIFYSGDPQANFTSLMTCADKMAVLDALFNKAGVADNFTILLQKNGIQNGIEKLEEKLGGVRILSERLYLSAYNHRALFIDLWDFLSETSTETALATILGDASRERYSTSFAEIDAIVRSSQQGKSLFDLLKEHGLLQALMTNPNYRFMQYGEELLRRVLDEGSLDSLYNDTWTLAVEDVEGGTPLLSGGTLEVTANGDIQYDLDLPPTLHVTWDNEEGQEIPLDTTLLKTSAIIDTVSNRGTTGIKLMEQKMEGENPDSGVLVHVTDAKKGVYTLDLIFDHFWKKLHVRKYYYSDPDFQIDEEANSADPGGTLHFSGYLSDCSISLCPDDPEGDYIDADGRLIQLLGKPIKLNIIANGRKIQIGFDLTQFRIDEADRSRITLYPIISSTGDTPSTSESQSVQFHTLLPDPTILDSYTEPLIIRDSYGVAHDIVVQFLYEGGSWKASIADPGGAREFSFGNEGVVDLSESTEAILTATWDNHATSNITFVFGERIIEERAVSSIGDLEDTETANSLSGGVTSSQEEDEVLDMTQWVLTDQGLIEITYANGVTKSLYQVPLLNCADPVRLTEKAGIFLSNRASGEFQATSPGAAGLGTIQTSALEASTVDLAQELSRMIKAQHAYAANTHVLSTIDQMLQELERV